MPIHKRIVTRNRLAACILVAIAICVGGWFVIPANRTSLFADAIRGTDRIVVHARGFDEYAAQDRTIFLEISDPKEIAAFNANIKLKRTFTREQCGCQGFPGIDWYRDGERVAFVGVQHKTKIRWSAFDYDLPLTDDSVAWLEEYLGSRNVPLVGMAEAPSDQSAEYEAAFGAAFGTDR